MKVEDKAIEAIHCLPPQDIMKACENNPMLREKADDNEYSSRKLKEGTYVRAQEILKDCPGSFSEDINTDREERV